MSEVQDQNQSAYVVPDTAADGKATGQPRITKWWNWEKFQAHLEVVKEKAAAQVKAPVYDHTSLCMKPTNPFRAFAIKIAHAKWFDNFILALILANCVFMMIGSPYPLCCREGHSMVESYTELTQGCVTDVSNPATTFTTNTTGCTAAALADSKCSPGNKFLWRKRSDYDSDGTAPAWEDTKVDCCVTETWARNNGIYQADAVDKSKGLYPGLQPQLCLDVATFDATRIAEVIFLIFFTIEMVVKIIAMGFVYERPNEALNKPGSYLRDAWNWLDFIVVISAYLPYLDPSIANLTVLRTFRVLRPLRALNKWQAMKSIVRAMMKSLPPMKHVVILLLFVFLVFGIIAVQLWNGILSGRCYYLDTDVWPNVWTIDDGQEELCGMAYIPVKNYEAVRDDSSMTMKSGGTSYTVISDFFYESLEDLGGITSTAWYNGITNATLVAQVNTFAPIARPCSSRTYGTGFWSVDTRVNISTAAGPREVATMMCRQFESPNFGLSNFDNLGYAVLWIFASITLEGWVDSMYNVVQAFGYKSDVAIFFVDGVYYTLMIMFGAFFMLNLALAVIWDEFNAEKEREEEAEKAEMENEVQRLLEQGIAVETDHLSDADLAKGQEITFPPESFETRHQLRIAHSRLKQDESGDPVPDPWGPPCIRNYWYRLAINAWFGHVITFVIILNTLFMALEYHDWVNYRKTYDWTKTLDQNNEALDSAQSMPTALVNLLDVSNLIFTIIFIVEMVIKHIGLNPYNYWADHFNKFDGIIVILSIVELVLKYATGASGSGLSVLRAFRLLRVFRLAKAWKELQKLLTTIVASLIEVSTASVLLLLMMFIFTLLGMQIFGGTWTVENFGSADDVPRANFDNFWWGFVTVFQVLTGENWNDLLWAGLYVNGAAAVIYFLLLNWLGNYMILNLFLAILLEKFEKDEEEEAINEVVEKLRKESAQNLSAPPRQISVPDATTVSDSQREQFEAACQELDPKNSGIIPAAAIGQLLNSIDYPMGMKNSPDNFFLEISISLDQSHINREDLRRILESHMTGKSLADAGDGASKTSEPSPSAAAAPGEVHDEAKTEPGSAPVNRPVMLAEASGRRRVTPSVEYDDTLPTTELTTPECNGLSLMLLAPENPLRRALFGLVTNKRFDQFILLLIGLSSLFLAMDEPWVAKCACYDANDPNTFSDACTGDRAWAMTTGSMNGNSHTYYSFLLYSDLIITIIFTFEMVFKIIAFGFAFHKHSYMRSGWNVLDCFIVIVSLIALATGPLSTGICGAQEGGSGNVIKALRSMRALRALRPLRVVRRFPGMRLVVNSIFEAGPQIMNVMMVTFLFFLIFGIVGQQFWTGEVAQCNDGDVANFDECFGNMTLTDGDCGMLPSNTRPTLFTADEWEQFADPNKTPRFPLATQDACELAGDTGVPFPRVWASKAVNFDGVGHALLTVYEVSSGEMWPDIMYDTTDTVGIGKQMQPNMEPQNALYYIFVQIVCAFLMLNVFVGVVIEKYNENKDESEGSSLLSNEQKLWVETMKLAMGGKAKRRMLPPKRFKGQRMPFFKFVTHPWFDLSIMACIILNTILMGCRHFDQGPTWDLFLEVANIMFAVIFTIEMFLKLAGIGSQYVKDAWNIFDGTLVVFSWIGYIYDLGALASLFRIFRVARMFRLIRSSPGLLNLLKTLIFSIPALINVGAIVVLIKFILACIAMNSFGNVKYGELLNPDANFQTFWLSFNTLWRISTGESYNGIMHDCALAPPYCSATSGGVIDPNASNCGSPTISYLYFVITFTILNYIMLNLFVAIILDNFADASGMSKQTVTAEHIDDFDMVWMNEFDPTGSGKMPFEQLGKLLEKVDYPLGLKNMPVAHLHGVSLRKHKNRIMQSLEISHLDGMIDFKQTRRELVKRAMGDVNQDELENSLGFKNLMRVATRVDQKAIQKIPSYSKSVRKIPGLGDDASSSITHDQVWKASHVTSAKIIQAMLRGYWYRKNLDKLREKWRQQIELARRVGTKQALGAPDPEQTLADASADS